MSIPQNVERRITACFNIRGQIDRARRLAEAFGQHLASDQLEAFLFDRPISRFEGEKLALFGATSDHHFRVVRDIVEDIVAEELRHD